MTPRILIFTLCFLLFAGTQDLQSQTLEELKELQAEEEGKKKNRNQQESEETTEGGRKKKRNTEEEAVEEAEEAVEAAEEAVEEAEEAEETAKEKKRRAQEEAAEAVEEAIEEEVSKEEPARVRTEEKRPTPDPRADKPYRTWSLMLMAGFTNPYTDIRYKDFFGTIDPISEYQYGIGLSAIKMFNGAFGLMGNFTFAKVQGVADTNMSSQTSIDFFDSRGLIDNGLYHSTTTYQGSLNIYWNISNTLFGINRRLKAQQYGRNTKPRVVSFYTYVGLGMNYADYEVRDIVNDALVDSAALRLSPDASNTEVVIPFGLGLKFRLGSLVDLGIEANWNFVLSDRFDGMEWNHPSRGKNDKFSNIGATITFKLGTKKKDKQHIEWVNPLETIIDDFNAMERKVDRLSSDSDGDGVSDAFDVEDDTPEGVKVDGSGAAMDVDYDGVPDHADEELFSGKGATVDDFGRAIDSDKDGVPDYKDREPNTAAGKMVNFEGISIADNLQIGEPEDWNKLRGFNFNSVFFGFNSTAVGREYEAALYNVARALKENEGMEILIVGHTDLVGSEEFNIELGRRRAEAVAQFLIDNYGVDESQFEIVTKGKAEPASETRNSANRRVDFIIK